METVTECQSSSTPITSNQPIVSTATSAVAAISVPAATPSEAIIIYRRDTCYESLGHRSCFSTALEYDITPGQSVDTCEGQPNYAQTYPKYEGGVTSNYLIKIGPFVTHGIKACSYNGSYQDVGNLICPLMEVPGSVPTATAHMCAEATDTPIVYIEW